MDVRIEMNLVWDYVRCFSGGVLAVESHVKCMVSDFCFQVTPDLLRDQSQSSGPEVSIEEDQIQQIIYGVLRQG